MRVFPHPQPLSLKIGVSLILMRSLFVRFFGRGERGSDREVGARLDQEEGAPGLGVRGITLRKLAPGLKGYTTRHCSK